MQLVQSEIWTPRRRRLGECARAPLHSLHPHMVSAHDNWQDTGSLVLPSQLTTALAWWYRSDLGITLGTGVSAWADQSGNGRNLAQATGSKQPVYNANGGPNNLPYLSGTSAALTFIKGTWTLAQPLDVFLVARADATLPQSGKDLMDGGSTNAMVLQFGATASTVAMFAGTTLSGTTSATLQSAWQRWEGQFNGASSKLLVAGSQVAAGNAGTATTAGLTLFGNASGAAQLNCSIVEAFAFAVSSLPAGDAANVALYLQSRYGVA